ncbi:MAG TPA: hypothetical protein VFE61_13195, partial [Candidatus Sulfotelmatobacter sp.]|nr:hypothetical protein [Candidatus Sulfotelmatobacter sp.]
THVTTYRLAKSPYATLYTGGSDGFVVSTAAPIATGWSDPVPGRAFLPAVDQRFSRRTVTAWLEHLTLLTSGLPVIRERPANRSLQAGLLWLRGES